MRDATGGGDTVTDNTVAQPTAYCSNDVTVYDNTVLADILKGLAIASQPKDTKIMESDTKVLSSVMMQYNVARCQKIRNDPIKTKSSLKK